MEFNNINSDQIWDRVNWLAQQAYNNKEIPIGAILLDDQGSIIAESFNSREASNNISDHAEILTINKAGQITKSWKLNNFSLFVTLEPCLMCFGAIINSRIKNVYFMLKNEKTISSIKIFNSLIQKLHIKEYRQIETQKATEAKKIINLFFNQMRTKIK